MIGHACDEPEVVWPLHRWHYLSVMSDPPLSHDPPVAPRVPPRTTAADTGPAPPAAIGQARGLAARALQCGAGCTQIRTSALLGVSRRQIGRETDAAPVPAPPVVEGARMCLAETASRGSTVEERDAATVWLEVSPLM